MFNKFYRIFGKKVSLSGYQCKEYFILVNELSLYPEEKTSKEPDLYIEYVKEIPTVEITSINPSSHIVTKNGFICNFGCAKVYFQFENGQVKKIYFSLKKEKNRLIEYISKFKNIQYTSTAEAIGQIFHELVMVPTAILNENLSIVHASTIKINNKVVMLGGTGGVGKTSIELEFCFKNKGEFISDDIAVIDSQGTVFPNLAYPKIYGYNIEKEKNIQKKIFSSASLMDKLSWRLRSNIKGIESVRRRVSPGTFYNSYCMMEKKADYYLFIKRGCDSNELIVNEIDKTQAANISNNIIIAEYFEFYNHILWNEVNGEKIQTFHKINENLKKVTEKSFDKIKCFMVNVPNNISHDNYKKEMISLLGSLCTSYD